MHYTAHQKSKIISLQIQSEINQDPKSLIAVTNLQDICLHERGGIYLYDNMLFVSKCIAYFLDFLLHKDLP